PLTRRRFLKAAMALAAAVKSGAPATAAATGETLYNGIRLSAMWPPRLESLTDRPLRPPYLDDPPAAIPIDVGRQLFVDDFLIEQTTLVRRFHRATYVDANPVLRPSTAWERVDQVADRTGARPNPAAMPFSDGVFYDSRDRLFKMCTWVDSWARPAMPFRRMVSSGVGRRSTSSQAR